MSRDAATLELVPASRFDDVALASLFSRAYADYFVPLTLDAAALRTMIASCDLDLGASRVALRAGEPVGFAMLGLRERSAWVGGMAVVPDARRAGVGRALMRAAAASARE